MSDQLDDFITKETTPHIIVLGQALEEPEFLHAITFFCKQAEKESRNAFGQRGIPPHTLSEFNGGVMGVVELSAKLLEVVPALYDRYKEKKNIK